MYGIQCYMLDFQGKKVHFIGVCGISCNALAKFVLDFGGNVSGSDRKLTHLCDALIDRGAQVWQGEKESIDADIVVYSSAIREDNKELVFARKNGILTLERQEFLGEISRLFATSVAIAGTHGKTSTTAMLTHILKSNDFPFLSMIGGECVDGSNYVNNIDGKSIGDLKECIFVCEACEYKRHMLWLKSDIGVITNIECDHPDCYNDIQSVKEAFDAFAKNSKTLVRECEKESENKGEFCVKSDKLQLTSRLENDCAKIYENKKFVGVLYLEDEGEYNCQNALFAICCAKLLGVDVAKSINALGTFKGVKRRFERCASIDGVPVIFDFAHHPSEIKEVLKRAQKYGKVLVVFQPHTYSRTRAYLYDFADALTQNDCICTLAIMPTYPARETPFMGVDSDVLAKTIFDKFHKTDVVVLKSAQSTVDFVSNNAKYHDLILMIGAGDIYDLKDAFKDKA